MNPHEKQVNAARSTLLLIVILSVVNIFSLILSETYFLFSAYLPQIFIGMALYVDPTLLMPMIVVSIIYILPYLLCFFFAKKRKGWLVGALVLFLIDSAFFLLDFFSLIALGDYSMIMDLVIRAYAIFSLVMGVISFKKIKENA